MTTDPVGGSSPIDQLPPYVTPEGKAKQLALTPVSVRAEAAMCSWALAAAGAGCAVSLIVHPVAKPRGAIELLVATAVLSLAVGVPLAVAVDRSNGPSPSRAISHLSFPIAASRAEVLCLIPFALGMLLGRFLPAVAAVAGGGLLGSALVCALVWSLHQRRECRTGWWVLRCGTGRRRSYLRTYLGDGLVIAELGWRLGLPAPAGEVEVASLPPFVQWAFLQAAGRHEEALAFASAAYQPSDPTWAGWAALSALALGRSDEAERWIQRSVDDGYRGTVSRRVAGALAPLHDTDAWRALRRQTRLTA